MINIDLKKIRHASCKVIFIVFFLDLPVAEDRNQYLNYGPSSESTFAGGNVSRILKNQSDINQIPSGNDDH